MAAEPGEAGSLSLALLLPRPLISGRSIPQSPRHPTCCPSQGTAREGNYPREAIRNSKQHVVWLETSPNSSVEAAAELESSWG